MNFIDNVYVAITKSKKKIVTEQMLFKQMGLSSSFDMHTLQSALQDLVKKDKLVKTAKGKYMLAQNSTFIRAKIMATKQGYGFARPVDTDKADIFIPEKSLNGAVHGDTVLVSLDRPKFIKGRRSDKLSGFVEKIIERGYSQIVGLFTNNNGANIVIPDDQRFADSVFVAPTDSMNAKTNTKVVLKILEYPSKLKMATGKVLEVLGDANDLKVTTLSIIRSYNLIEEFPQNVLAEANKVNVPVCQEDFSNRKDYTKTLVITIDGEDARDFDDAINLVKKNNKYYLTVHIADVSHYVKEGSLLDAEAFKRGTSVYFPDYVLPMLPVELSNNICSLNPGENRLAMSVDIVLDDKGTVLSYNINKGVIKSAYRMTYTKVTKILNGDKQLCEEYKEIVPMLKDMAELALKLIERRNKAGQLDFDLPEPQIIVDKDYNTTDIIRKPRELADRVIEQFMVLTNEVVAKHYSSLNLPFVYRVHEDPTPERIATFSSFVSSFGLKLNKAATPTDFQKLLMASKNQPYSSALSKVMLRSMQKARYSPENLGHFGLALKNYCHFTSPIRRYPDLCIHRIITYALENKLTDKKLDYLLGFVEEASLQSSLTERNADQAERTVDDQKKAEFMKDKIGQIYNATVSGASDSGVFVELDNTVEGLIYLEKLPKDHYIYDEKRFALVGKKRTFRIGDKLVVKLDNVDVITRHIDFCLATKEEESQIIDVKLK